ncbi:MAG: sugar transferase [Bdellovibrionota bacterium]
MSVPKVSYRSTCDWVEINMVSPSSLPVPSRARREQVRLVRTFSPRPQSRRRQIYTPIKRVLDFVSALVLLVVLLPVLAAVALLVRVSSSGPVIFRQRRLTDGGREFTMFKFRTMYENAERSTGAIWASSKDPRITTVGRFLRKSRLDELPQLVNVLRGEMSLIGPRPERPELVDSLEKELPSFRRRMEVRAGITGLAQTANGYASSIESYRKKLAFDILYVKNHCFLLDMRIAMRTVYVILTGSGSR